MLICWVNGIMFCICEKHINVLRDEVTAAKILRLSDTHGGLLACMFGAAVVVASSGRRVDDLLPCSVLWSLWLALANGWTVCICFELYFTLLTTSGGWFGWVGSLKSLDVCPQKFVQVKR